MNLKQIRLFPEHAPKAVENFIRLAQDGFYNGIIFHRVIKKFVSLPLRNLGGAAALVTVLVLQMIQTGDPLGDGTGGMSVWGSEFEDEFSPNLRHDRCVAVRPVFASRTE